MKNENFQNPVGGCTENKNFIINRNFKENFLVIGSNFEEIQWKYFFGWWKCGNSVTENFPSIDI